MKTLLSSGILGVSLSLIACSGGQDTQFDAEPEVTTTSPPATPEPMDEGLDVPVAAVVTPPEVALVDETPPTPERLVPPTLAAAPELHWRPCGAINERDVECAELEVPIDYDHPEGEKVAIAMRRVPADPLEPHRGSLLFNPGGPGGEGIESALGTLEGGIFDQIAPGFDIVGFDPRGVADSGERACGLPPRDMYASADPQDATYTLEGDVNATREYGERCEQQWGPLFRHLGSNNVVRDMEELRKALGERVLNFYGASYGTRLAALYAHSYPKTTGRMVLDGVASPQASLVELARAQTRQGPKLHEQVFAFCEAGTIPCPPNSREVFEQIRTNARARGLEQIFLSVWYESLAYRGGLFGITQALAEEAANPGGDWILSFLQDATSGGDGLSTVVLASTNCTDDVAEPPTLEQLRSLNAEFAETSPLFGINSAPVTCTAWPVTRDPVPLPTAIDAPPLLVIGGTMDLRTPYEFAQAMTETLGNATLLTSNHFGHCALGNAGDCVYQTIRAYLTSGSLPASGASCPLE
jgi:pimeloyl-ACP methyl ester carboxylesterase